MAKIFAIKCRLPWKGPHPWDRQKKSEGLTVDEHYR